MNADISIQIDDYRMQWVNVQASTFFDITNDLHFEEHNLVSNKKNSSLFSNMQELIEKANL